MTSDPLFYLVAGACLVVLIILAMGIGSFGRGGKEAGKRSNRLMQYRIIAQFVAILAILLFVWLRRSGG